MSKGGFIGGVAVEKTNGIAHSPEPVGAAPAVLPHLPGQKKAPGLELSRLELGVSSHLKA